MDEQDKPMRGLSIEEQETVVIRVRADEWTYIETTIQSDITALTKKGVEVVESGWFGTTAWAKFRIASDQWNPARGVKRQVNMTDEQKERASQQMKALRAKQLKGK